MLNFLEVHSVFLVPDKNAYSVLIAFFVNLSVEPLELLVQTVLAALVDSRSIEDVDGALSLAEESSRKWPFLLCL